MSDEIILTIDGKVERPLRLTFADLANLPGTAQVHDVSRFHPTRKGDGANFDVILDKAGVLPSANYLTLHADRDDFHVSVPLEPLRGQGIRRLSPRPESAGSRAWRPDPLLDSRPGRLPHRPVRRVRQREIPEPHRAHRRRGRDTRPADEQAHEELHAAQNLKTHERMGTAIPEP